MYCLVSSQAHVFFFFAFIQNLSSQTVSAALADLLGILFTLYTAHVCTCMYLLSVGGEVEISVPETAPYYPVGQNSSLVCKGTGTPPPILSWSWQPCGSPDCPVSKSAWVNEDQLVGANDNVTITNTTYTKTLHIMPQTFGYFKCTARNEIGTSSSLVQIVLSGRCDIKRTYIFIYKIRKRKKIYFKICIVTVQHFQPVKHIFH